MERNRIRTIVAIVPRGCTPSEIVLALTFVAAGHADALQVAHRARIFGRKRLRINAERTREALAVRRRRAAFGSNR